MNGAQLLKTQDDFMGLMSGPPAFRALLPKGLLEVFKATGST
jgi:hypothetical protein